MNLKSLGAFDVISTGNLKGSGAFDVISTVNLKSSGAFDVISTVNLKSSGAFDVISSVSKSSAAIGIKRIYRLALIKRSQFSLRMVDNFILSVVHLVYLINKIVVVVMKAGYI